MTQKPVINNFAKRVLSALVLAPIGVWSVYSGGPVAVGVACICACIAAYEWSMMLSAEAPLWKRYSLCGILVFGGLIAVLAGTVGFLPLIATAGLIGVTAAATGLLLKIHPFTMMFGAVYISVPFGSFVYLREFADRPIFLIVAIMIIVWGTDTAGYLAGKAYGGPLLSPKSSPGKTWTGAIGGVIYAALGGAAAANLTQSSMINWVLFAVFLSIAAQQGDLLESKFKRKFGLKDMSNIIPGHGGLLDRLDGLMAAISIAAMANWLFPNIIMQLMGE